jgi:dTDP-4-dehydrorhamnose 3,5-epimerase
MKTHIKETSLANLVIVEIDFFQDERGFFIESWHKRDFAEAGLDLEFVQEGHSRSGASARVQSPAPPGVGWPSVRH